MTAPRELQLLAARIASIQLEKHDQTRASDDAYRELCVALRAIDPGRGFSRANTDPAVVEDLERRVADAKEANESARATLSALQREERDLTERLDRLRREWHIRCVLDGRAVPAVAGEVTEEQFRAALAILGERLRDVIVANEHAITIANALGLATTRDEDPARRLGPWVELRMVPGSRAADWILRAIEAGIVTAP